HPKGAPPADVRGEDEPGSASTVSIHAPKIHVPSVRVLPIAAVPSTITTSETAAHGSRSSASSRRRERRIPRWAETAERLALGRPRAHPTTAAVRCPPMIPAHTDVVGSLLRPPELLEARERFDRGELPPAEFKRIEDAAVDWALGLQEDAGIDVVT